MALSIRDAAPGDLDALAALWVEAWAATMPHIDFPARQTWFRDKLSGAAQEGFVIRIAGAGATDAAAGFILLSPALRYLDQLAVHPSHWGKGVAEALIGEARRLSPQGVVLDVNQANARAVACYEKSGFERRGASRSPRSGRPTWWYVWGEASPPPR